MLTHHQLSPTTHTHLERLLVAQVPDLDPGRAAGVVGSCMLLVACFWLVSAALSPTADAQPLPPARMRRAHILLLLRGHCCDCCTHALTAL